MLNAFVVALLAVGVVMITANELAYRQPTKIVYRYLPRDLDEYIRTAPMASNVFSDMFTERDIRTG